MKWVTKRFARESEILRVATNRARVSSGKVPTVPLGALVSLRDESQVASVRSLGRTTEGK